VTENIYPTYYELFKSAPILSRKAIIKTYEETGNISGIDRLFPTTDHVLQASLNAFPLPTTEEKFCLLSSTGWADIIRTVYGVDPLLSPNAG